jgi:hypothetical protein
LWRPAFVNPPQETGMIVREGSMDKRAPRRPFMLLLAAVFLFESWFWQGCIALGRRIVALVPWDALKARISALVAKLPAPVVLVVFLIPVAIIEPMQTVCVYLTARGHLFLGIIGFITLKFLGLGLIAVMFDLTRDKLLSMPWFAWVYAKFTAFHAFAHDLVEPYKAAVRREMQSLKTWARDNWARLRAREDVSGP